MVERTVLDARCYVCGHLISGPVTIYTDKGSAHPTCVNCSPPAEDRIAELEAENEQLRKALEPFAEAAENLDDDHKDILSIWESPAAVSIDAGDLRTARRALEGGENG